MFGKSVNKVLRKGLYKFLKKTDFVNILSEAESGFYQSEKGRHVQLSPVYKISYSVIGDYTYIAQGALIQRTTIGKFCSVGPHFICGWGIHPVDKLSTSPMFYSTLKQNGITLTDHDKIEEMKPIIIGNDVFIGMNVTVLDGITIGDGAVIGAGTVVSKDIPPYAIAVGSPVRILRYRFSEETISKLLKIQWWNFKENDLKEVEHYFDDVEGFLKKYYID